MTTPYSAGTSDDEAIEWWRESATTMGANAAERSVAADAGWEEVLASGRRDLDEAFRLTGMRAGLGLSLLEIGCGPGRLTFALADYYRSVMGTDVSPGLLEQAAARNDRANVRFALGDGRHLLPQSRESFDVVFSAEVFHHLERDVLLGYFRDAFRLLRPGGQFVFQINVAPITWRTQAARLARTAMFRCGKTTWRGWPNAPGFRRRCHPVAALVPALRDAGFAVEKVLDRRPAQTWVVAAKPADAPAPGGDAA